MLSGQTTSGRPAGGRLSLASGPQAGRRISMGPPASARLLSAVCKPPKQLSSVFARGAITNLKQQRPHLSPVRHRSCGRPVAMVNVDLGPATILGTGLVLGGLSLWQMRASKPELSRDMDVVFSSMSVVVGGILIFQGWRLDPLLLFGQLLTVSAAVAFCAEAIGLRDQLYQKVGDPDNGLEYDAPRNRSQARPLPPPGATSSQSFDRWQGNRSDESDSGYGSRFIQYDDSQRVFDVAQNDEQYEQDRYSEREYSRRDARSGSPQRRDDQEADGGAGTGRGRSNRSWGGSKVDMLDDWGA